MVADYIHNCLVDTRAFIPASIFKNSVASLASEAGYSRALAHRLFTKKCLWLVRMSITDINKIHASDLTGKFNPIAQGLDIIEMGSLMAAYPEKFANDSDGRKQKLRLQLEQSFKDMWTQLHRGTLPKAKTRNAVYDKQVPAYQERLSLVNAYSAAVPSVPEDEDESRNSFSNSRPVSGPVAAAIFKLSSSSSILPQSSSSTLANPLHFHSNV